MGGAEPSTGEFDRQSADIVARGKLLDHIEISLHADFAGICK